MSKGWHEDTVIDLRYMSPRERPAIDEANAWVSRRRQDRRRRRRFLARLALRWPFGRTVPAVRGGRWVR